MARSKAGAVITDEEEAIARVISMVKEHTVTAITGKKIEVIPDSICLHGDNPKAVLFSEKIRKALEAEGVTVAPIREVIA